MKFIMCSIIALASLAPAYRGAHASEAGGPYEVKIELADASGVLVSTSARVVDRETHVFDGSVEAQKGTTYHVEITPFLMTTGSIGVKSSTEVTRVTAGKTATSGSTDKCSFGGTAKVEPSTKTQLYSQSGVNTGVHVIPGCALSVTVSPAGGKR